MAGDCRLVPMQQFSDLSGLLRIMLEPHVCQTNFLSRHLGECTWHRFGRHGANARLFARKLVQRSVELFTMRPVVPEPKTATGANDYGCNQTVGGRNPAPVENPRFPLRAKDGFRLSLQPKNAVPPDEPFCHA